MNFLKDTADIKELIVSLIEDFQKKIGEEDIHSQVIDPFSSMIEASINQLNYENWLKSETSRQRQKTLQNAIGRLHQKLLGQIRDVEDLEVGQLVDVVCNKKRIIAEVKTKHNTVKKTDLSSVYDELKEALKSYDGYTAYYVEMIPAKPLQYNEKFRPIDNNTKNQKEENERIRRIDGKSFYELLTDDPDALQKMYAEIKKILIEKFDLQQAQEFDNLFQRAYDIKFFLKNKYPKISVIEEKKNIQLIENTQCSGARKLTWQHNNCKFKATINELCNEKFICPICHQDIN